MDIKKRVLVSVGILIILVLIFYFISSSITKYTGFFVSETKDFEDCLKENDITVYINSNNFNKTLNNLKTKNYLENFKAISCLTDKNLCVKNNINYSPTWIINSNRIKGDISVYDLSIISGCKL